MTPRDRKGREGIQNLARSALPAVSFGDYAGKCPKHSYCRTHGLYSIIFARWDPLRCIYAALLFGGAGALGPALQSIGISEGHHLFNAAPCLLTLGIMLFEYSPGRSIGGAPGELTLFR